ncbi:hypothetical protein HMPREF9612_01114 [Cutibacterium acnes HL063PA2]|nr:hypothetical protein HMPREF9612_01114 [Cutibacterium acnes HL063PA2]
MPAATMVSNTPKTTLNVRDRRFGAGDVKVGSAHADRVSCLISLPPQAGRKITP